MGRGYPEARNRVRSAPSIDLTLSRGHVQSSCTGMTPARPPGSHRIPSLSSAATITAPRSVANATASDKRRGVLRACGAEAEVDDARARFGRPVNRADQPVGRRRERAVEHFHRVQLSMRRLFTNGRGDGGAVSNAIAKIVVLLAVAHRCAARDPADVRVVGVNAAVDDRDAHAAARAITPAHERPARPRARRTGARARCVPARTRPRARARDRRGARPRDGA